MVTLLGWYDKECRQIMKRILIDLTDLELWNGAHGGTQRVVYGIAKYFYLQQESLDFEVVFIAFSSRQGHFNVTSFEPIYERAEAHKTATAAHDTTPVVSIKTRVKQRLRPYVPETVRRSQTARKVASKSLRVARRTVVELKAARQQRAKGADNDSGVPIHFHGDDTVLILGKPWDNLQIQDTVARQKATIGFKVVQVVYDLIISLNPQLHHPSLFTAYTQNMFNAVSDSDLLLPISKSSAQDLKKFCRALNLTVPKVEVIRLGDEIVDNATSDATKPDARIEKQFIACIGTIEIRKNHMLLYYAYKLGLERGIQLPQLVIVGSRGWLSGDFQYLVENDPVVKRHIIILDSINDAGLSWVYQNCQFTVYPSMYEGWGLPVAESLAYGKMCVASNSSSIPEIAGDLIEYFSPYDAADCLDKLVTYLDKEKLAQQERQITAKYQLTTWSSTFDKVHDEILKLYK